MIMCVYTFVSACVQVSFSTSLYETSSLAELGAHRFVQFGWLVSPRDHPVSAFPNLVLPCSSAVTGILGINFFSPTAMMCGKHT